MSIIEENIKKINDWIRMISWNFECRGIDVDLFVDIYDSLDPYFIGAGNAVVPYYDIKKEKIISYALDFYEYLDKDFYDEVIKIILQIQENTLINFFNIHSTKLNDFVKNKEYKVLNHGRLVTDFEKVFIMVPYRSINKKIECGTVGDIFVLCHELAHYLDLETSSVCMLDVKSAFIENNPRVWHSTCRSIFPEVITATIENILMFYLLKNTNISRKAILRETLLNCNERANLLRFTAYVIKMVKLYKQSSYISVSDVEMCTKNKYYVKDETVIKRLILSFDHIKSELRYSLDSIFSPLLIRSIVENKDDGIKKLKEYIRLMKADDFKGIFGAYSVDFDKKDCVDIIVGDYEWYKSFIDNLLKEYLPNGL